MSSLLLWKKFNSFLHWQKLILHFSLKRWWDSIAPWLPATVHVTAARNGTQNGSRKSRLKNFHFFKLFFLGFQKFTGKISSWSFKLKNLNTIGYRGPLEFSKTMIHSIRKDSSLGQPWKAPRLRRQHLGYGWSLYISSIAASKENYKFSSDGCQWNLFGYRCQSTRNLR